MRLSVKGFSIACALSWAGCILFVELVHLARPEYGTQFLAGMSSVYPWFHSAGTIGNALTVEGFIDGLLGGALFAWLYNLAAKPSAA